MHIVVFLDQHAESLGGAQLSVRLQRRFLERRGHRVTICSPRSFRHGGTTDDPAYWLTPAIPITPDREYSMSNASKRTDRLLDRLAAAAPPVDIVHIQADFWQAAMGIRFAERHGLPVVLTLHNRLDAGIAQMTAFPGLAHRLLNQVQRWWFGAELAGPRDRREPASAWRFLRVIAQHAQAVIAPSRHFAELVIAKGVATNVEVIPTGVDDDLLDQTQATSTATAEGDRPIVIWAGRMSQEKRLLEFLRALDIARPGLDVRLYGSGVLRGRAGRFVASKGLSDTVRFMGQASYPDMLAAIAGADALVQTSRGFETQGMTVFEAIALGTPVLLCDPQIADELPADTHWLVDDDSVEALAAVIGTMEGQLRDGTAPAPGPEIAATLVQSTRAAELERVYLRVLAQSPKVTRL